MRGFVRIGTRYVASLDEVERTILGRVVADTADLLGTPLDGADGDGDGDGVDGDGADDDGVDGDGVGPASHGWSNDPLAGFDWPAEHAEEPDDPALARLLPAASRDDDAVAEEFRRLTEGGLRRAKVANLRLVWAALRGPGGPLAVPRAVAGSWAAALTDVRLVIASRLGIETDDDAERVYEAAAGAVVERSHDADGDADGEDHGEDDGSLDAEVRAALSALYAALTWLQESLLQAMLDDVDEVTDVT